MLPVVFAAPQPTLTTSRLRLRPYAVADAADLQRLAGDRRVAATTATIPHPYPDGAAEAWIATHPQAWHAGERVCYAITSRDTGELFGTVSLVITPSDARAELGYWIAVPVWGHGYATEAATALCNFGFAQCALRRITAHYLAGNGASGRVMEKLGMRREGYLRAHVLKWGEAHDLVLYGILAEEWHEREARR